LADSTPSRSNTETWLAQAFATALARVVESMTGEAPQTEVQPADGGLEGDLFWWEQTLSVAVGSVAWVGASRNSWKEIGSSVLKAAGVEDDDEAGFKSTYQEVVSQAFSGLAQSLSTRLKREIACPGSREAEPGKATSQYRLELKLGSQNVSLTVVLSSQLVNASEEPAVKTEAKPPAASKSKSEPRAPKSLDLLFDVELPVSVSFGRAQLPLKDVIKLTTGSIVELNRAVSEPVEIIVNNCVIARGQVVVVEGNFGVRIQQVISRQERLRTLR
jgi:flagellar motor switch protein FliN/FliY